MIWIVMAAAWAVDLALLNTSTVVAGFIGFVVGTTLHVAFGR